MTTSTLANDAMGKENDGTELLSKDHPTKERSHLELFSLIWLDAEVNDELNQDVQEKLRLIINDLQTFENKEQCQQFIEQCPEDHRLMLIVSGRLGREVMSSIHSCRQILAIYVYCFDKEGNEKWAKHFTKIKAVIVEESELIDRIAEDMKNHMKPCGPLSIKIVREKNEEKEPMVEIKGHYQNYQLLIECLLNLKPNETDKKELFTLCEKEFVDEQDELETIWEFQRDYTSDKSLWWYTRQSFFNQLLNRALNNENIHIIFLFRSFLADMHRLLQEHRSTSAIRVYRDQQMTYEQLEILKQSVEQLICIKSFLLASTNRSKVLTYLSRSDIPSDSHQVLFEINADPKMAGAIQPFADITAEKDMGIQFEVLFMFGSTFRLLGISQDENQIWIVRMTLCSADANDLKTIIVSSEESADSATASFQRLAKIVWSMGEFHLAEKYYQHFLNELASNDPLCCSVYADLSQIAAQKGDHEASAHWLKMAAEPEKTTTIDDDSLSEFLDCETDLQDADSTMDSQCASGGECKDINDLNHAKLYQHPGFCSKRGYCSDMSQDHLVKYRHVPLCENGLKCPLMIKKNAKHCSTHRHYKLRCQWGGFCPHFHDHEHLEVYSHPFNTPCPFTPYVCQFHVKSLQNQSESDHLSPIDEHCFRYAHVCPFGRECTLLKDNEHIRTHIHIARRLCPQIDNCTSLIDENHLNSFMHSKIRDIRLLCQYSNLECRDRLKPEHKKRFRHSGNCDHIGIVHFAGLNQNIDFVRNQTEMIEGIPAYRASAKWSENDMTIPIASREWIRALQPVHRCHPNIFESILLHGHVMSRDHMNSLRDSTFITSTVRQHKKTRLILDRINHPEIHRIAEEYIQKLVELAFHSADQVGTVTDPKEVIDQTSKPSLSLDVHSVELKLRQKEQVLGSYLSRADFDVIRALTIEIVRASLQLLSIPTGIGYEADREFGTNKHVFSVLGPHAGYYYGDIFLVFRHELMFHPDANFSIQAATTFGKSKNAYRFRPWLVDPGTPEARIGHFRRNKLHCSIMGYECAAASELIALTSLKMKSTAGTNLKAIEERWMNSDSHLVFEAHLPKLIPLDYVERVYIAKTTFDSLTESAQQSARVIFGNGLIITCHEIDVTTKPAGLHQPLDDKRKAYQSFVLSEMFAMIEAKTKSLPSLWGTVITVPASKFQQHILIPITISQSYEQYRSSNPDLKANQDDGMIYIYWQAMHGDMMLSVTNEVVNSQVEHTNLICLVCYIAERPLNSTVEQPSQPIAEYHEGYTYISDHQPMMHEVNIRKRQVKAGSNSFHRGCNIDDYITYCLTINRQTGEVILAHAGSDSMYIKENISYRFDKNVLDLTTLDYIQVTAGSQTVAIRDLLIRHDRITELHPSVDPAFQDPNTISNSISKPTDGSTATLPDYAVMNSYKKSSDEQLSTLAPLVPCPDSVHCLVQYREKERKHNAEYSHPCRFSELCRNKSKESHLLHIPHLVPICSLDRSCNRKGEPLHRAQYRHSNLPDYLVPCRAQTSCKDTTPEHRIKYSHGEKIPLPGHKD